jgi:hypothetical protein
LLLSLLRALLHTRPEFFNRQGSQLQPVTHALHPPPPIHQLPSPASIVIYLLDGHQ